MRETLGVLRYEYLMQIRRWGLWISMLVLSGIIYWFFLAEIRQVPTEVLNDSWRFARNLTLPLNFLAPVAAGILVADRFPRDRQLGMGDTLRSALRSSWPLVVGRCSGSLLAALTPQLVLLVAALVYVAASLRKPELYWMVAVIMLAIILPSWFFIVAWSLVLPLVFPLRLYQVLYGGFWLWATLVPPTVLPTINQSIFDIAGTYASHAFFHDRAGRYTYHPPTTAGWAIFNMALLVGLSVLAVALTPLVLRWQEQRA
jgi:hypothetical protein